MISFWVNREGAFGIERYLNGRGKLLADRFAIRLYAWRETLEVARGPHIFSALDQLTAPEREATGELYAQLARLEPRPALLNDPRRCLMRYELLERLADAGLNSFRAYRADETARVSRFPVFVRENLRHDGPLTRLLRSAAELRRALLALRIRGYRKADLLVVEFCDTSDRNGLFRKYSAFRIGDAIIPSHVMIGRSWSVNQQSSQPSLEAVEEELAYHERNPHQGWLQRVFTLAGVEYGRIDFGVLGEQPQAWEINTNPTIGRGPGGTPKPLPRGAAELKERVRQAYHARLRAAFSALARDAEEETVELRLDPHLLTRIAQATRRTRRRTQALTALQSAYRRSRLATPLRALLGRWIPRP